MSTWSFFQLSTPCGYSSFFLSIGQLNDDEIPTPCEGDVLGALSMLMLSSLTKDVNTLMNLVVIDGTDETILLWHCGPTAMKFADEKGVTLDRHFVLGTEKPGQPNELLGVVRDMLLKPGTATINGLLLVISSVSD
jgi:L-fucose isomerase-like protein